MRIPLLWITAHPSPRLPTDVEVLRVTSLEGTLRAVQPGRLSELTSAAGTFLDEHHDGCIVLDSLDLLLTNNGVERVVRAIEDLHDDVVTRSAMLFVYVESRLENPRLLAWLERELDAPFDLVAFAAAPVR